MSNESAAADVRKDRGEVYGSVEIMQTQIAAHWTALLRSHYQCETLPAVPPRLIGLMLACVKLHRAAVPYTKRNSDSYVDSHNYIDFSMEMDDTLPRKEVT